MRAGVHLAVGLVALGLACGGCFVTSMNPLFEGTADLLLEPELLGEWSAPCSESGESACVLKLSVSQRGARTYALRYTDEKGQESKLRGFVAEVAGQRFLDVDGDLSALELPEGTAAHLARVHSFWRMRLQGDELRLATLDVDWVDKQKPATQRCVGGNTTCEYAPRVLIEPPVRLRALLRRALKDSAAFGDEIAFRRQAPPSSSP